MNFPFFKKCVFIIALIGATLLSSCSESLHISTRNQVRLVAESKESLCKTDSLLHIGKLQFPLNEIDSINYSRSVSKPVAFIGGFIVGELLGFALATPVSDINCKGLSSDNGNAGGDKGTCQMLDEITVTSVSGISLGIASVVYFSKDRRASIDLIKIENCKDASSEDDAIKDKRRFKGVHSLQ